MTGRVRWGAALRVGACALVGLLWASSAVHAAALRYCDRPAELSAGQHDKFLRFAALIKDELERSGHRVALVSRSGLDLQRFGLRYSHAGVSLQAGEAVSWSVRQLYYACDERRPRLYDQGLSGFVLGVDDPQQAFISVVLLPAEAGQALERAALDKRQALDLLGAEYSANAYAFGTRYQNCNQWLMELLAVAWGGTATASAGGADARSRAQAWLQGAGYVPTDFDASAPWLQIAAAFIPWVHHDDHPPADDLRGHYRVSMPDAMEAFVRRSVPGARRLEFCRTDSRVVLRRGWEPLGAECVAAATDTEWTLE